MCDNTRFVKLEQNPANPFDRRSTAELQHSAVSAWLLTEREKQVSFEISHHTKTERKPGVILCKITPGFRSITIRRIRPV